MHYPTMRYNPRDRALIVASYHHDTKHTDYHRVDEALVIDFGRASHGMERFTRGQKYDLIEAPLSAALPAAPDEHYLPVGLIRCVVPSLGIVQLIVDCDPLADALSLLYERYVATRQATQDQVPLANFDPLTFEFKITDWIDRNPALLGKRLLPVPGLRELI